MANIIECPICDSRFDASGLPDGSKIKCSKCKKIVGKLAGGSLVPILEAVKKAPVQRRRPTMYSDETGEYEEVVVRRRVGEQGADMPFPAVKEKQDILLAVAGIVGIFAMLTLIYTIIKSQQIVIRAPMPVAAYGTLPNTAAVVAPAVTPAAEIPKQPVIPATPVSVNPITPDTPVTPEKPATPVTPETAIPDKPEKSNPEKSPEPK
ncbi:MAG: hypothetical protein V1701_03460 [Planctomycetota bacterium]